MSGSGGRVVWGGRVISGLVSLAFLVSAFMKLKGGAQVTEGMAHLGLAESLIVPLAILLTGYMGGAICTHLRAGDPFYFQIGFGILVWLGLYLRESRLKALIPLRRT